jgi:hypothetical protein
MNLIEFLNSTAAEAAGGLITASIVGLVKKIKDAYRGKSITQETLDELIANNSEAKEIVMKLQDELIKCNIINNADRIEIKNQFINSKFDNTTFN